MKHLVLPLRNVSYETALNQLQSVRAFLAVRGRQASVALTIERDPWGIAAKRQTVDLRDRNRPDLIGKDSERLVEVINMVATLERLIDAICWFRDLPDSGAYTISECHPSTSCGQQANDLVLVDRELRISSRCEVTDVAGDSAGQNGKEKRDLKGLGCETIVPDDSVRRFICTSAEFANALCSHARKWNLRHYRYLPHPTTTDTTLLELTPVIMVRAF